MSTSQWSDLPLVLTSNQAAIVLQINRRTLTNMLDRGALRGVKIGKEWRVSRTELMRFVEGHGAKTPSVTAPTQSQTTATLVDKEGVLVVRTEPLADLTDIVTQEREQRIADLLQQVDL